MKISKMRLIKGLSLVGMLALCLLLTGCVVPPDDIGANGNYVVTDGNLPFQSLGPAITNTPYVPPVNTPTSAPTRNPVVTKAPTTPNPGSTGVGNTTIPGQSLPNVTAPQIQVIINTSTATPSAGASTTLKNGSTGAEVKKLQQRLKDLGYLKGSADGDFGDATESAVKAFQAQHGLSVDGKAGANTLHKLYSSTAKKAAATNTPRPTATPFTSYKNGDTGSEIRRIQNRLKALGYLKGSVDGTFGDTTEDAVRAFQKQNRLTVDGKVGAYTLDKLFSASAKDADAFKDEEDARNEEDEDVKDDDEDIKDDPSDVDNIQVNGYTTLRWGDTGAAVKKLQEALKNRGYYDGKIDSTFGSGVYAAIKAFQKQNGLKVDGVAGPATQTLLYGSSASSSSTNVTLKLGSTGTKVRNLQYVLYELGYYDGAIDGDFDDITASSVRHFQMVNGISPVDGVAGYKTLNVLYSKNALSASTSASAGSTTYTALSQGDKGTLVVEMQEMLQELGYLSEVTGTYDDATVEAVKNFQRRNDLTADGKAGPETQKVLYGPGPKPAW